MGISDRDRAILDLERTWLMRSGPKEDSIRDELGISSTRYYQLLGALVDDPEAYEYDPLTVRRVRRARGRRRRVRIEGRQVRPYE